MRGILKNLIPLEPDLWILTKSDLITRDIDLIRQFKNCIAGVSLSLLDEKIQKEVEPLVASPERRINAVKELKKAGFPITQNWSGLSNTKFAVPPKEIIELKRRSAKRIKVFKNWKFFNALNKWLESQRKK